MVERIDVAVIGTGGAGYPGAFLLGRAGRRVLMVDPIGNIGGDCLAEGCVPSKTVREFAQAFQRARRDPLARLIGVCDPDEDADDSVRWSEVLAHKDAVQQSRYAQHAGEIPQAGLRRPHRPAARRAARRPRRRTADSSARPRNARRSRRQTADRVRVPPPDGLRGHQQGRPLRPVVSRDLHTAAYPSRRLVAGTCSPSNGAHQRRETP
ncbi:hypothetical protein FPZ11_04785 [Humibacter ginsenosidimutans]|uniref:FAD/NAD(P)-binding domain-containing protein n=1 Tax=Humibacter ginsenosidimutans TaxID=2599293 RepID=A0A5B8M279_9MICO|nr:hypothetical protein FPZ11_04785 [Humibacter ginsenosidimutans]